MDKLKKDIILCTEDDLSQVCFNLVENAIKYNYSGGKVFVMVYQDGNQIAEYPLAEDLVKAVSYEEEHYNLLLIENGKVSVSDADCPDQLCVKQRSISKNGESIICLPHRLVVQVESGEERELDAVTY